MRKSTFNAQGVAVAGHVKFEIDVIKLYQETGQKYHVFWFKRTTPGNKKLTYAFNKPFLTYRKFILPVSILFTYNRQLKWSSRNLSKIYSLSLEKRGDPELSWLFHTKIQLIHQNVKIQVRNLWDDHFKWSIWFFFQIKVYFYRNFM